MDTVYRFCRLEITGSGNSLTIDLSAEMLEGRGVMIGRYGDIVVDLPGVSRRHCRLWKNSGVPSLFVEDLSSTNGSHLNNHALRPHDPIEILPGDRLYIDILEITFGP